MKTSNRQGLKQQLSNLHRTREKNDLYIMNKTIYPYYIFEVDCPLKMVNGECQADSDCTSCQGKGKRRRITWPPEVQPDDYKKKYPEIKGSRRLVYYNNQEWYLETWLEKYSNVPVLPTGETLEIVELKQVKDIPLIQMPKLWPPLEGEAWLCTALIKEKT